MTVALAPLLMIASGSIHAIVNAIVKGGRDKMAARAMTDGSAAAILPASSRWVLMIRPGQAAGRAQPARKGTAYGGDDAA